MPSSLLQQAEQRLPSWYQTTQQDVFVLVKAWVSDRDLCQAPLLVLPGCKAGDINDAICALARSEAPCP